ncbi:MAG: hypothetical protein KBF42_01235 [Chitinophagales bacterium]|jgi:hypothetical protein|nr:hypothetical protein [Bacteroidota bacterium]MBP8915827.1 hypothetical protein [Chitinophagales bacterium]MBP8917413.1 hypothetical protein [Chitinophagales bacterium]MBP9219980.1 hypothetical protein [Chitinophagales bacterium]MBP9796096.1 hypothetical protein [Chitinophagales bacterium]
MSQYKSKKEQIPDRNILKESKQETPTITSELSNIIIGIIVIVLIAAGLIWIVDVLL